MRTHCKRALKFKGALAPACAALLALGAVGCASTVSTSAFKGEQHNVAQAVANLQADLSSGDQHKVCADDLANALVARLKANPGGCEAAVKSQLAEVDNFELTVHSVAIAGSEAQPTATARVISIYSGKSVYSTLSLVKQGGKWKISGVG